MPGVLIWLIALAAQFGIGISVGYITTRAIEFPFLKLRDTLFPDQRKALETAKGAKATI
jgi:hypothetical protein